MEQFVHIHLFFVICLLILELLYFAACVILKDAHKYIFRIRVLLPAYYLAFALVLFTGLLLSASLGFEVGFLKRLCILVFMFALAIYQFICFKKARKAHNLELFRRKSLWIEPLKLALFALGAY